AINGDLSQALRERTIENLKRGRIDILVATDVAARGLDVERISHVINYDIPHDTEAYIHRIGRTGRAGRTGDAILFVSPREKRLLSNIERATKQKVEEMQLPSTEVINNTRVSRFKQRISDTLAAEELGFYTQLLEQYEHEHNIPAIEIAAALAHLVQGDTPLLLKNPPKRQREKPEARDKKRERKPRARKETGINMELFRIEVGRVDGVKPGNIVGAIANEAGIEGQHIASIKIEENYSTVELPSGMPKELFQALKKIRVVGKSLKISHYNEEAKKKSKRKKRISSPSKRRKEKES
ncbi:MAG: DbpA RNA binding domain-containing protein, partial [Methylococcales bacterium]|nr:DbpA RNA binding domain-containing protein [Methylococcales bacterium]